MKKHPEKRRRLARILAVDIATEETLRSLLLHGLLRDIVTKRDLVEFENRLRGDIKKLEDRIDRIEEKIDVVQHALQQRIDNLLKWIVGLLASIWLTLITLLLPLLLKTLGLIR